MAYRPLAKRIGVAGRKSAGAAARAGGNCSYAMQRARVLQPAAILPPLLLLLILLLLAVVSSGRQRILRSQAVVSV